MRGDFLRLDSQSGSRWFYWVILGSLVHMSRSELPFPPPAIQHESVYSLKPSWCHCVFLSFSESSISTTTKSSQFNVLNVSFTLPSVPLPLFLVRAILSRMVSSCLPLPGSPVRLCHLRCSGLLTSSPHLSSLCCCRVSHCQGRPFSFAHPHLALLAHWNYLYFPYCTSSLSIDVALHVRLWPTALGPPLCASI